jgi:hypothetical protein
VNFVLTTRAAPVFLLKQKAIVDRVVVAFSLAAAATPAAASATPTAIAVRRNEGRRRLSRGCLESIVVDLLMFARPAPKVTRSPNGWTRGVPDHALDRHANVFP